MFPSFCSHNIVCPLTNTPWQAFPRCLHGTRICSEFWMDVTSRCPIAIFFNGCCQPLHRCASGCWKVKGLAQDCMAVWDRRLWMRPWSVLERIFLGWPLAIGYQLVCSSLGRLFVLHWHSLVACSALCSGEGEFSWPVMSTTVVLVQPRFRQHCWWNFLGVVVSDFFFFNQTRNTHISNMKLTEWVIFRNIHINVYNNNSWRGHNFEQKGGIYGRFGREE